MGTYYEELASAYDALHGSEQREKLKIAACLIPTGASSHILDIGAGTCISHGFFKGMLISLDPSFQMLRKGMGSRVQGIAEALPFMDKSFDFCICMTAIHNFTDFALALDELQRVCKKGAVISILRRSAKSRKILEALERKFDILKVIKEGRDDIVHVSIRS